MKDYKTIKDFIRLRAAGYTYNEITEKINVSRPTLTDWNKRYRETIVEYEKYAFADLFARNIIIENDMIIADVRRIKNANEIKRKTAWEEEVKEKAFSRLTKIFLKHVIGINMILTEESKIAKIQKRGVIC